MAKKLYIGVNGIAREVKKIYIGVNGVAREVKKGYIGIGGSAREFFSSGKRIKELPVGTVVYLKLSLNSLAKRLGNLKGRGVLLREGQTLESLYEERTPLYEKYADIVVDQEGKDLEASLELLLETLKEKAK